MFILSLLVKPDTGHTDKDLTRCRVTVRLLDSPLCAVLGDIVNLAMGRTSVNPEIGLLAQPL